MASSPSLAPAPPGPGHLGSGDGQRPKRSREEVPPGGSSTPSSTAAGATSRALPVLPADASPLDRAAYVDQHVESFPALKASLLEYLGQFKAARGKAQIEKKSLAKVKGQFEKKEPPRSLLPSTVLSVPKGSDEKIKLAERLEALKFQYAMGCTALLVEARTSSYKELQATANNAAGFFTLMMTSFQNAAPDSHAKIVALIGLDNLQAWWQREVLRIEAVEEERAEALKREATAKARLEDRVAMELDEEQPSELLGRVVDAAIKSQVGDLLAQVAALQKDNDKLKKEMAAFKSVQDKKKTNSDATRAATPQRAAGNGQGGARAPKPNSPPAATQASNKNTQSSKSQLQPSNRGGSGRGRGRGGRGAGRGGHHGRGRGQ